MEKTKAEEPMRTMTKERKKEGPRLGHKGRADAKASRQLLLLCIPAIIGYILFNYIPMGAAVIIPFKNYKFSKGILGSDWCGLANFKWIIQSVALDRALRNTVLYGLLFMVLSPVTNVIIALLLFEITSRRRLKTYQTIGSGLRRRSPPLHRATCQCPSMRRNTSWSPCRCLSRGLRQSG